MASLLLVKSGCVKEPVTKVFGSKQFTLSALTCGRGLNYLGAELPHLGEPSNLDDYRGPEHVVVSVSLGEAESIGKQQAGFYLVTDLHPATVIVIETGS